jgi:asparagine synthase (glutamine-hydrolysing)
MCGICGVVDFSKPVSPERIDAMVSALRHRGPDANGCFVKGPVGIGHTRLSIIDLSEAGSQPMHSADGRFVLSYNGEVYNFAQLRRELEAEGCRFVGNSDTEVVLYALARWGRPAIRRFHGMFAIALWDEQTRELLLARDRFGIKPLYYAARSTTLTFASEVKSIRSAGDWHPTIDPAALHEYMWYGNALGERTMYEGVRRLLPGQTLTFGATGASIETYWRVEDPLPVEDGLDTAVSQVRERLEQAVSTHLISDVPVGVFLSGGIDSSAITAFAARHYSGRLRTYSVGFDFEVAKSELTMARLVAQRFDTDHAELHVAGADLKAVIESLVDCHDEPFGDAANIPLYLLCQQLRGSVKVVLQGDGGDEMFAGYRRHAVLSHAHLWGLAARLGGIAGGLLPARHRRFLAAVGERDSALRMALLMTMESAAAPPTGILSRAMRDCVVTHDPFQRYRELDRRLPGFDPLQRMLRTDAAIVLPDTFLEKVDKSTMAHGIEVRVPFLDDGLSEYAMGLPGSMKVHRAQTKWILRRALRTIVPDDVLDAPKTGFSVPYGHWLRTSLAPYLRDVMTDPVTDRSGLFDRPVAERLINEHVAGTRDHGFLLWKSLHLALWNARYLA